MADEKISAMPGAGALGGSELVPIVQGGVNVVTTPAAIAALAATAQGNYYANYGGTTPTPTPASGHPVAIDSSTGNGWIWSGSAWVNIF